MQFNGPLDVLPLWGFFLAVLLLVLGAVDVGYRFGRYRRNRSENEKDAPVGSMAGATLGLLAFMLAFTFGLAASRFDVRRQVLLDEANAIETTYLRAGMLPERRDEIRGLLREYVDVRIKAVRTGNVAEGIRRSVDLHDRLWVHAVAVGERNPTSLVVSLFTESLNELINLHSKRIGVARYRIPLPIWGTLFIIAVLSLATMGYHAGLVGTSRSIAQFAVGFAFSVVILLIADLDRPQAGMLKVSQQPLLDLQQAMERTP